MISRAREIFVALLSVVTFLFLPHLAIASATISGTVYKSDGTTTITGVQINVNVYSGNPCGSYQHVTSGSTSSASGAFSITGVPAGTYFLRTWNSGAPYLDEWWASPTSTVNCTGAQSFTVSTGETITGKDFQLDSGGTISGTVYQSDGTTPVTGQQIRIQAISGDPCGSNQHVQDGWIDTSNGTYTIGGLPAGTYYLWTDNQGANYTNEWWAASASTTNCSGAQTITVTTEDTITDKNFQLDAGATISGTVYQSDGTTPITESEVGVQVFTGDPCGTRQTVGWASYDTYNGTYQIGGLLPGTYYLQTYTWGNTNYVSEWWASTGSVFNCSGAQSITVTGTESIIDKDFQLATGATVSGTVYQSDGTTPITGMQIHVNVQSGDPCGSLQHVIGESINPTNGTFSITRVPAGTYYLRTWNNGAPYLDEWYASPTSTVNCTGAQSFTVSTGETITGKDFQLDSGGTISGTVYQSDGTTPVTGQQIQISAISGDPCGSHQGVQHAWTNSSNGTYTIGGLPAGTYYLRTNNQGANYTNEWWASTASTTSCTGAQSITVTTGNTVTGKNFQLDPGATISGTVYQSDGTTPITESGVGVHVITGDPCGTRQTIAWASYDTSNGTYQIGGLLPGTYYLQTYTWGNTNYVSEWWASSGSVFSCTGAQSFTVSSGQTITGKNFQLDSGGTISGTVYQSDGTTPITGIQINVDVFSGNPCGSHQYVVGTITNSTNGTYSIAGVPAGTYYLRTNNVGQSNYMNEWWASPASSFNCADAQSFSVASEQTITGKNFQLDTGTTITGTVTSDTSGQPVAGVQICGWPFPGGTGTCTTSQSDGLYTLSGLQTGYTKVQASGAGYLTEFYDNSYDQNWATAVNVTAGPTTPNINFSMGKNGSISGTVYQSDGITPLANVCVDVYRHPCASSPYASAQTDTNGNYTIANLPPQAYYVKTRAACTSPQHYVNHWYKSGGGTTVCDQAGPVTVASEQNTSGINFSLSPSQATYPGPVITSSALFSSHSADESISTAFWARISGPSPEDVASFTVTGPSGTFNLGVLQPPFRQFATSYQVNVSSVVANGAYTFVLTDSLGRTATVTRDFTYDATVPQVDSATMTPVNQAYVGTVTPTLTWDPVAGAATYQPFIWDYDGKAIWYTETTEGTSVTVPEGWLQPDTPYYWWVRVNDATGQNRRYSNTLYFYTGTKGLPDLSHNFAVSYTTPDFRANWFGVYSINLAPWDINSFNVTGPNGTVYPNNNSRNFRFYMPLFYQCWSPGPIPMPDSTYTFELSDTDSNTDIQTHDFTYNPVPTVSEASRFPAPNAYLYTNRTYSWAPVSDPRPLRYKVRISDYNSRVVWYESPYTSATSWTIPDDIPRGPYGSYKWQVMVSDSAENNLSFTSLRTITGSPLTTNDYTLPKGTGLVTDYRIFTAPFYMGSGASLLKQMEKVLGTYDPYHWRVFALHNGSFIELNSADFASLTIIPGMGFWIISLYDNTVQFQGALCPQSTSYQRELSTGWHMIALPWPATDITLGSITVTDGTHTYAITDDANDLTQTSVWEYTGSGPYSGYEKRQTVDYALQHGTGYYFKVLASDVRVIFPPNSSSSATQLNKTSSGRKPIARGNEEPPPAFLCKVGPNTGVSSAGRILPLPPDGLIDLPQCLQCSGAEVDRVLENKTFDSLTPCECTATESITIGKDVIIQSGANVTFKAPKVNLKSGFHAEAGAVVNIKQE